MWISAIRGVNKYLQMSALRLVLVLIFISSFSIAQEKSGWKPGYVVTGRSDTLKGLVKKRKQSYYYKVDFKQDENSEAKLFTSNEVKFFQWGDEKYRSVFVPSYGTTIGQYSFAAVIEEGLVSLYNVVYETGLNGSAVQLSKAAGIILKNEGYVRTFKKQVFSKGIANRRKLSKLLADNKELAARVLKNEFTFIQLPEIVKEYNKSRAGKS